MDVDDATNRTRFTELQMRPDTMAPPLSEELQRRKLVNRLRRLEGQVRGVSAMIESDKECEAVLTQVMATKSALNQVGMHVIGHAMKTCLIDDSVTERDALITAAFDVFLRYRSLRESDLSAPGPAASMTQAELVDALGRLDDQLQTVERIVASNGDCDKALNGLSAATTILDAVGLAVLGRAMHRCLIPAETSDRTEVVEQAIDVFLRYSSCAR